MTLQCRMKSAKKKKKTKFTPMLLIFLADREVSEHAVAVQFSIVVTMLWYVVRIIKDGS